MINSKHNLLFTNIRYGASTFFNSRIVTNLLTYSCGALLIRGISFFTVPLVLHKISPSEYGTLSLLTAFMAIMTAVIGLGLRQVLSIEYFHATPDGRHIIIQDILIIYTVVGSTVVTLLWLLRDAIIRTFFFNTISSIQLLGLLITTFLFFYNELMYQLLQYQQKVRWLMVLQGILAFFISGATLFAVFYGNGGITGIIWAQAAGAFIATIIAIISFFKYQLPALATVQRFRQAPYYIKYGLPFIPGVLASWILSSANRWILGYFMTMREVGIYAVADLACQLFYLMILQSWTASYLPFIMHRYQTEQHHVITIEQENQHIMWITMIGLATVITLGYPCAWLIVPKLLPPAYLEALQYAWILLMGQIFLLASYFLATLIQYKKHVTFLAFALFIPALCNVMLNLLFVPYWGILGCSIATLISYIIYFMIVYLYNKKIIAADTVREYQKGE